MIDNGSYEYGVISQEISEIFPSMVKKDGIDFLPTLNCFATVIQITDNMVGIAFDNFTDIIDGDKVRIVLDNNTSHDIEVEYVTNLGVYFKKWKNFDKSQNIYVYGKEYKDVQVVTKNSLFMVNIKATQELADRVDKLEADNKMLHARIEALEKNLLKE